MGLKKKSSVFPVYYFPRKISEMTSKFVKEVAILKKGKKIRKSRDKLEKYTGERNSS